MHTIATGLDYVITEHLFSTTRVSYQNTYAERTNGEGVPTLAMLGVKSWMYTQGKIPGQDMLQAGLWSSGLHRNLLCQHAAVLTGLRLDAWVA